VPRDDVEAIVRRVNPALLADTEADGRAHVTGSQEG
jgi:hypothetical protein